MTVSEFVKEYPDQITLEIHFKDNTQSAALSYGYKTISHSIRFILDSHPENGYIKFNLNEYK